MEKLGPPISSNESKAALYAKELPWNTYRVEELGPTIMEFCRDHEPYFRRWAEIWYQNFQFVFGNHNLKWSHRHGFAVDYDFVRRDRGYGMRTKTNLSRGIAEALSSFMFGNVPTFEADAMLESSIKGKRWQKIAEKLLAAYMQRLCMHKELSNAAFIYVLFGQYGAHIDWHRNAGVIKEIPRVQKLKAPVYSTYMTQNPFTGGLIETPTRITNMMTGQPVMEDRWEPVLDSMGRQIIDRFFTGDAGCEILTPFEYRRQIGSGGMHKTKYTQRFLLLDYDEWLDRYEKLQGRTKFYSQVRPVYSNDVVYNMATKFFMRMQFTTPPSLEDAGKVNVFKSSLMKHKVFVVEHYDKPHPKKWPDGRMLVISNGECTHVTTPSYNTGKMGGWHPLVEAQWMAIPPSSIAAGPMNDVIGKNNELNIKDGLISTAVRRNMGSHLIIKNSSGLDADRFTGEPGLTHTANDIFGARYLHDEMPIPPVISRLRELDKEDVYESSGAMDALRGEPSRGATSGYQEKQRQEREERRLSHPRQNFRLSVAEIGEKLLHCVKSNCMELDKAVMGFMMRSGAGEFTPQDVIAFLTSPLDYGIDIKIDESSMAIKSQATHQATLMELAGGPGQQRLSQDAKVLDEFFKAFDAQELRDDSSAHRDRAQRENEVFLDMLKLGPDMEGLTKPIVLFEDDDLIHMAEHSRVFVENFEQFRSSESMMLQFMTHMEHHRMQDQEKQAKLMPGAATQVGPMMEAARQSSLPTPQVIAQDAQMRRQTEAAHKQQQAPNPQAPQGQAQAPQSPRQGSTPGGGPGKIDPNAPSQNTPQGRMGGPPQ